MKAVPRSPAHAPIPAISISEWSFAELVDGVRTSQVSDFYARIWGNAEPSSLPVVTREDFTHTPLSRRRYKDALGLVKVVHDRAGQFLSEWAFEDIAREPWGISSKRPMVYLESAHEAIEKSMWCYKHGMVPLIGEKEPAIAAYTASRYRVDSLITDARSLLGLEQFLRARGPLESITLIGDTFDRDMLRQFSAYARTLRLVLYLPETGAIAESTLDAYPMFTPVLNCRIEYEKTLVITKLALLITPVIRYKTLIAAFPADSSHEEGGFVLL